MLVGHIPSMRLRGLQVKRQILEARGQLYQAQTGKRPKWAPGVAAGAGAAPSGGSALPGAAKTAFREAIAQYEPGGGFGKGVEAGLERGRTKALASGMQSMVSAGLAGTTAAAGIGKKYEEEVAAPTRAGVESERAQRISQLKAALATAEQRGYETAEDRALRSELTRLQASTQIGMAGMQAGTARAGFASQERMQTRELATRKYMQGPELASQERIASTQFGGPASQYGRGYYT